MKKLLMITVLIVLCGYSKGQHSYFPVEKGMSMTYAFGSEIYKGTPYETYQSTVKILEETETIEGKEYFVSESSTGNKESDPTVITSYCRFGSDGSLFSKANKTANEILVLKKTPKVGDKNTSQQGGTSEVVDLNATIKTPTDTYSECLMIEVKENETLSRMYYQKNTGMVATTMVIEGNEKIFIYLLSK